MTSDIEFGSMRAKIEVLERDVKELKHDMRQLLELANHSKGAFWASMSMASALGAVVTFIISHWPFK